jgi:hypothetical protein
VSYKRTNYRIYILYLTKEFLYGIFLMTKLKILTYFSFKRRENRRHRGAGRTEKRRGQNLEKGTRSPKVRDLVEYPGASGNFISTVSEMPFHAFWAEI